MPAPALDPERNQIARSFVAWLHEWREVARATIARRDYRISLGLAQRRQPGDDAGSSGDDVPDEPRPAVPAAATAQAARA